MSNPCGNVPNIANILPTVSLNYMPISLGRRLLLPKFICGWKCREHAFWGQRAICSHCSQLSPKSRPWSKVLSGLFFFFPFGSDVECKQMLILLVYQYIQHAPFEVRTHGSCRFVYRTRSLFTSSVVGPSDWGMHTHMLYFFYYWEYMWTLVSCLCH